MCNVQEGRNIRIQSETDVAPTTLPKSRNVYRYSQGAIIFCIIVCDNCVCSKMYIYIFAWSCSFGQRMLAFLPVPLTLIISDYVAGYRDFPEHPQAGAPYLGRQRQNSRDPVRFLAHSLLFFYTRSSRIPPSGL